MVHNHESTNFFYIQLQLDLQRSIRPVSLESTNDHYLINQFLGMSGNPIFLKPWIVGALSSVS